MTLNPGETSLVLAGAWNPAILTPSWVLRYGLDRPPDTQEQVQIALPAGQGVVFDFPRYGLADLAYVVRPEALILNPSAHTPDGFAVIERVAGGMLRHLPHTPVNGIGHNFEFRDSNPAGETLDVFTSASQDVAEHAPDGWESVSTLISSSFRVDSANVIANVQRQFDGANVIVKFNFHHPISNLDQAQQVLTGEPGYARMHQNYEIARNLLTNLYGSIE
jgi:hypothetical protein